MRPGISIVAWSVAVLALAAGLQGAVPTYSAHTLQVQDSGRADGGDFWSRDLDGDGLSDVISLLPSGELRVFRQTKAGYPPSPSETWKVPDTAVWVDVADLTPDPGLEVVVGMTNGIAYYRQEGGRFDTEPVVPVEAEQVFAQATVLRPNLRGLRGLAGEQFERGLPVMQEGQVVFWRKAKAGYAPGPKLELLVHKELNDVPQWIVHPGERWYPRWGAGDAQPYWLSVRQAAEDPTKQQEQESNEPAERLLDEMRDKGSFVDAGIHTGWDVDGDGRNDALVFIMHRELLQMKTTLHLLLRRTDGQLPDKADQTLKVNGVPMGYKPLVDIDGDGRLELVMVEMRDMPVSMRGVAEMLLAGQTDCTLTVRRFDGKGFVRRPSSQLDLKAVPGLPVHVLGLEGDFNGDGRPDLRVMTSDTRIAVHLSMPSGRLPFEREARLQFDASENSYTDGVKDMNSDGFGDLVLYDRTTGQIKVYLSRKEGSR